MDMHRGIYSTVGIDPAGDRIMVLPNLGGSILGVAMLITRFENRFPPIESPLDLSWIRARSG
jgi:hypothetical protein